MIHNYHKSTSSEDSQKEYFSCNILLLQPTNESWQIFKLFPRIKKPYQIMGAAKSKMIYGGWQLNGNPHLCKFDASGCVAYRCRCTIWYILAFIRRVLPSATFSVGKSCLNQASDAFTRVMVGKSSLWRSSRVPRCKNYDAMFVSFIVNLPRIPHSGYI